MSIPPENRLSPGSGQAAAGEAPGLPPGMSEPWQAQLFALTVHLNERGLFDWSTWARYFGPALARHQQAAFAAARGADPCSTGPAGPASSDTLRDYFLAWQEALEQLLAEREIALPLDIGLRAQASGCYPRLARAPLVFRALAQAPGKAGPA